MDSKDKLKELRRDIDKIDKEMVGLFGKRMRLSERVAAVKAEGNIAILDAARERRVIDAALSLAGEPDKPATAALMRTLMALSKLRQNEQLMPCGPVSFPESSEWKRENVKVAFQGVAGAWGEHSANQIFPNATLEPQEYFENVFEAVRNGKADYGVLPIENSQTGAIGEVYDLLRTYSCYIVCEIWITVAQCLLAIEGASLSDIRTVYSHPEGFNQCRRFLKNRNWELAACRNTAYAAQMVAESNTPKLAAVGSRRAASVHGLKILAPDIMDNPKNQTRFIAISAQPVYDDTCTTTGITFSTAHTSGALCAVLQSLMIAGINMKRIESRPAANGNYRFFADLEANLLSDSTWSALEQAAMQCDYFEILGCYSPTVENMRTTAL